MLESVVIFLPETGGGGGGAPTSGVKLVIATPKPEWAG